MQEKHCNDTIVSFRYGKTRSAHMSKIFRFGSSKRMNGVNDPYHTRYDGTKKSRAKWSKTGDDGDVYSYVLCFYVSIKISFLHCSMVVLFTLNIYE